MRNSGHFLARLMVTAILASALFTVSVSAAGISGCPECGMVWKDTCVPFEKNNETAYNEELSAAFSPVAANQTPMADFSNSSWSNAFLSAHNLLK